MGANSLPQVTSRFPPGSEGSQLAGRSVGWQGTNRSAGPQRQGFLPPCRRPPLQPALHRVVHPDLDRASREKPHRAPSPRRHDVRRVALPASKRFAFALVGFPSCVSTSNSIPLPFRSGACQRFLELNQRHRLRWLHHPMVFVAIVLKVSEVSTEIGFIDYPHRVFPFTSTDFWRASAVVEVDRIVRSDGHPADAGCNDIARIESIDILIRRVTQIAHTQLPSRRPDVGQPICSRCHRTIQLHERFLLILPFSINFRNTSTRPPRSR